MGLKQGLNKKEAIQCAEWLKEGVPAKDIAKKFKTTVKIVERFTKERMAKVKLYQKEREQIVKEEEANSRSKGAILAGALDNLKFRSDPKIEKKESEKPTGALDNLKFRSDPKIEKKEPEKPTVTDK